MIELKQRTVFYFQKMEIGWNCTAKFESLILFIYQIYITVILLLIPLIMMIVLYGNIIVTLISGGDEDDKKRFGGCFSFANKMPKKKITNGMEFRFLFIL